MNNVRKPYNDLNGMMNVAGANINYYRTKLGMSAQKLSDKLMILGLDIHRQSIFQMEAGKRTITDYELVVIAQVLGTTTDMLLKEFIEKVQNDNK